MTDRIRWGILSTGEIAGEFAAGLRHSRFGAPVAVASRAPEPARAFAEEHGIERAYGSYAELLSDPDVDAVYVATPHVAHAEWSVKAARAGKHVLCEKPLTLNHAEAMAVVEAVRDSGVFLMEAFMYRLHPQTRRLVDLIREGAIGELRLVRASFSFERVPFDPGHRLFANDLGGGGILDIGGYVVSVARTLAAAARGREVCEPLSVAGVAKLNGQTGTDEYAAATMSFDGGILAELTCGVRLEEPSRIEAIGSRGRIVVDRPAWLPGLRSGGATEIVVRHGDGDPETIAIGDPGPSFALEADMLAVHAADGEAPMLPLDDTLANMRTLDRWRHAVGLVYERERPRAGRTTVAGDRLAARSDARMRYERIDGVDRPLSKLVMGVDNQPSYAHAAAIFDDFFEHGGTTFDTAWMYGQELCCGDYCEERLGQWIEARGVRDEVAIVNKGAHSPYCFPGVVRPQLLESLRRLRTDRVEVYMLHRDNPDVPVGEFVDALEEVREEGLVQRFGASNWTRERFDEAQRYAEEKGVQGFSVLSNQFSLAAEMVEPVWPGVLSACGDDWRRWLIDNDVPLLAWSTLARGFLAGRSAPSQSDPEVIRAWHSERNFDRLERLERLAAERGVAPATLAMAYVLHQPFPTFALIGPRTIAESRMSLAALDVPLSSEEVDFLAGAGATLEASA